MVLLRSALATGAWTAEGAVVTLGGTVSAIATTLRAVVALAVVSAGAWIAIADKVIRRAGRGLLSVIKAL